jgi:hypothetical protein
MGEGSVRAPALVGERALPSFETARDVYDLASVLMPGDAPGTLARSEYMSILAFALLANGIELEEPLSMQNASETKLRP